MIERYRQGLFWCVLLIVAVAAYWPGLGATFLLDDYATLPYLGQWGGVTNWDKFWEYITSGFTGPTGRPVALLTFLLHGADWPTEPRGFIAFNIAIHMCNAALFYFFLKELLRDSSDARFAWIPLLAAAIWLLHPYQVSTVLYVIQRMVLLSVFFNLVALIAYLRFRRQKVLGGALLWLAVASVAALFSVFTKESAILIPLQLLLLDVYYRYTDGTLFCGRKEYPILLRRLRLLSLVAIGMASMVVVIYLLLPIYKNLAFYWQHDRWLPTSRPFNLWERLLTQQRIVGDYLLDFFIPGRPSAGVFWDGYPKSVSLLNPISTLSWLSIHVAAVIGAWFYRHRCPLLVLAILWFYMGLLVESTTVMLELKFEHRAYLPNMGLALLLAFGMATLPIAPVLKGVVVTLLLAVLAITLWMRATLWGSPYEAFAVWHKANPNSVRVLEGAVLAFQHHPDAETILPALVDKAVVHPRATPGTYLQHLLFSCATRQSESVGVETVVAKLAQGHRDWRVGSLMESLFEHMQQGKCDLSLAQYQQLGWAILGNRYYHGTRIPMVVTNYLAFADLFWGDAERGERYFRGQNFGRVPLGLAMKQALLLANSGHLSVAIEVLDKAIKHRVEATDYLVEQASEMQMLMSNDLLKK